MIDIILYGCGNTLLEYIDAFRDQYNILFICDKDKEKQGKISIGGGVYDVKAADELVSFCDTPIYVCSIFWKEIIQELYQIGCRKVYVPMANEPTKNDFGCCFDLYKYLNRCPEKWFGNRKDFNHRDYHKEVYRTWNNHYILHHMFKWSIKAGYSPSGVILDYGCGVGTMGLSALLRGYNYYGVEVDTWRIDYIKNKIEELNYPLEWKDRFVLYEGDKVPFKNETFDVVFSCQVLEHVKDVRGSLSEIFRVLKHGGFAYLHCPNYDRTFEEHYMIEFGKRLRGNKDDFKELVKSVGADQDEVDGINFVNKDDIREKIQSIGSGYEIIDLMELDPLADVDFIVKKV